MAERTLEDLLIQLDAETEKMRRQMRRGNQEVQKFQKRTDRQLDKIDKRFDRLGKSVKKFRGSLAAAAGGFTGGAGFAGLVRGAQRAAEEFDKLAKAADTRGLSTDFYQALQLAAEEAGVDQRKLNSSLTSFVKRVGEAKAGSGALHSGLRRLDPALLKNVISAQNQEEALRLISDAMADMTSATDRAALANAAFSRQGVDLVRVFGDGAGALDRTAEKARELGIVVDERILRNMEQVNNDFGVATRVIDLQFKQALIAAAPIIKDFAESLASMAQSARIFFENLREGSERSTFVLQKNITEAEQDLQGMNRVITSLRNERDRLLEGGADENFVSRHFTGLHGVESRLQRAIARRDELSEKISENAEHLARARRNAEQLNTALGGGEDGEEAGPGGFETKIVESRKLATEAQQRWNEAVQRGIGLAMQTAGPLDIYREKIEALKAAQAAGEISASRFGKAQQMAAAQMASSYLGAAGSVAGALGQVFEDSKGVAIAQAVINTAQGVTQALANYPPPLSFVQAAAQAAAGAAQIAKIKSTTKSGAGGGSTSRASGGASAGGAQGAGAGGGVRQGVVINLQGESFGREQVRGLIEQINDAVDDGARLNVSFA